MAFNHPYAMAVQDVSAFSEEPPAYVLSDKVSAALDSAVVLYRSNIINFTNGVDYPSALSQSGTVKTVKSSNWVSGFYPGCLWYVYEYSNNPAFRTSARTWTESLESNKYNTSTHDLGFMMYCSYGNGFRLTNNTDYKNILLQTSASLASRYNNKVGCIRSWDWGSWEFPVIIDNMMNLEMLEWASKNSTDTSFRHIAREHADGTLQNHFRSDYSSYHVVDYNRSTGDVISKGTFQGYSDASAWARGQAWALYGYTMMFREAGDSSYLEQAMKIADYFISRLPEDYIPFWDFDAPNIPYEPRDASSAAIAASALIELSQFSTAKKDIYFEMAEKMLESLMSDKYMAAPGTNGPFLLKHSTGNKNSNSDVDAPLIYADYYFLEALLKYKSLSGTYINKMKDVAIEEDFGNFVILDNVIDFYQLDTISEYKFDVQSKNGLLNITVNSENQLIACSKENVNGQDEISLRITSGPLLYIDEFYVVINPVNDPPVVFNLLKPENNTVLNNLMLRFYWEDAGYPDGDEVDYHLYLLTPAYDLVLHLTDNKLRKDFTGLLPLGDTLSWYVIADDGYATSQSNTYNLIPPVTSINKWQTDDYTLQVFPNPVKDDLFIQIPTEYAAEPAISVYDISGKLVLKENLIHSGLDQTYVLGRKPELNPGMYFIKTQFLNFKNEKQTIVGKFIKE